MSLNIHLFVNENNQLTALFFRNLFSTALYFLLVKLLKFNVYEQFIFNLFFHS